MSAVGPIYRDLIARGASAHRDRIAMIVGERHYSFGEVDDRANRLARALIAAGATKGTRIAILLDNGADSIPIDFAIAKAGLNKVPLNARLSVDEHVRMVAEARVELLLYGPSLAERARSLCEALPALRPLGIGTTAAGGDDLDTLAATQEPTAPHLALTASDVVLTLYTSGTTGVLKAAQHTQGSYAAICRNVLLNLMPIASHERMLHAASLIHASGTFVLPFWLRGACSVVLPGFEPASFLAAVERHRATAVNLVPTMLQMLLDHPAIDVHDLSSLRHIVYGASPMPRPLIERAIARFGQERFWQYYGQTEMPLCIAVQRPEDHVPERLGVCGRLAVDVELRLLSEDGSDAGDGPGEIAARAPSAAIGYFDAAELSSQTFGPDGWVRTRDVGELDQDGFLRLLDRTSDMIVTGGYNVYPREVEDALLSHPAVVEAAVVGAPDPKWVEAVVAFVVLRPDFTCDAAELIAHVANRIASYKKPHRIVVAASLPKTAVGKLDRKVLRRELKWQPDSHS
jgi:acyl-CoA synthetase (AMP-forming)/AMP-acid ligase II